MSMLMIAIRCFVQYVVILACYAALPQFKPPLRERYLGVDLGVHVGSHGRRENRGNTGEATTGATGRAGGHDVGRGGGSWVVTPSTTTDITAYKTKQSKKQNGAGEVCRLWTEQKYADRDTFDATRPSDVPLMPCTVLVLLHCRLVSPTTAPELAHDGAIHTLAHDGASTYPRRRHPTSRKRRGYRYQG